jgi:hypothetical protein
VAPSLIIVSNTAVSVNKRQCNPISLRLCFVDIEHGDEA